MAKKDKHQFCNNLHSLNSSTMEYIGSSFQGKRDHHRHFDNKGTYFYPTGSKFRGDFKDGQLHGKGVLYLGNGTEFRGQWTEGCYSQGNIIFADGLQWHKHDWGYCTPHDRRFYSETVNGLKPAGCSKLTDKDPPPTIPENCYDTGDGFYDPKTGVVTTYNGKFLRHANDEEHAWIVAKCRKGWDEVIGKSK